jgi:hypothetical protein
LTDDDGVRGATANQAGSGERRRTNPEKFHTKLNSCRTANLRLNNCVAKRGRHASPRWRLLCLALRSPVL